ncbi:alcohol dehydrogenase catalytic domain-containing protein [Mycobacteroides abscessus]|uniref:alcohol dehydrogenase catalytic domain-containing protein n=1 Tax=Mycobacteroides abscessus TaxID=36809 RepID=UPI0009A648B0|nr:alcohol dehydrogenase catalytic domain-containing protein [Mycobacteroides abscessus]SKG10457.1 alcohol dehydrogenase [Mycobacteroides abscessus subsp. massiliense]SKG95578.1 alcohol dehydrogenase [Mycobacteroides abscessus subsp. massiliense]SKH76916.1 alcohol dehydrogenase [Mycobacteroides abscessus subsp. massiliense]SKI58399.1 alcohol dehydrogenase [Mycobacteroides abscessus subsp. massiliense]SKI71185.1 alcohol dehydrogenase [Mycobacteroides abscessus subsp. massiliense]
MTLQANVQMLCESDGHIESALVDLVEPTNGLVQLRITASGVCHSDLHVAAGEWNAPMPIVLGHEGAGVVESVGPAVRSVAPGDRLTLSWLAQYARCQFCRTGCGWLCTATEALIIAYPTGGQQ